MERCGGRYVLGHLFSAAVQEEKIQYPEVLLLLMDFAFNAAFHLPSRYIKAE